MDFPTWVEIDLDRLDRNLAAISGLVGPGTAILDVIKADGYGLGAVEVGRSVLAAGAKMLGVATLHEGIELRQAGLHAPILILSPNLPGEYAEVLAWRLMPTLSTNDQAAAVAAEARAVGIRAPVHVEVDTGMGRTGFDADSAFDAIRSLAADSALEIDGLFTHFPMSDDPDPAFTRTQVARFTALVDRLADAGIRPRWIHAANSGGVLGFPESCFNMVRPGLALLGHDPDGRIPARAGLLPVVSLHGRLVQVREVPAGRHISYGSTFETSRPSRIGVVTVGYGHGLPRRLSGRGELLVAGRRVPIVGRVTMDLTMIDLTDHPAAAVGDDVIVFGGTAAPGTPQLPLEEVAAWAETIPWEILCQIDKRVVRKYLRGGEVKRVLTLVGERIEIGEGGEAGVVYSGSQRTVRADSRLGWKK